MTRPRVARRVRCHFDGTVFNAWLPVPLRPMG
jgi:hypothetical protein